MGSAVLAGDGIACIEVGDVLVTMWKLPARVDRVRWLVARLDALMARHPGDVLHLMLILPTSDPPDGPAREFWQEHLRARSDKLRKFVVVALGDSLRMNIVRAMGRSILFLSGQGQRLVLVSTAPDGMKTVRSLASAVTPAQPELEAAIAQLTDALGVKAASIPGLVELVRAR